MDYLVFDNLTGLLLVFVRMGGMVFFNPLFSRRNIPSQVRVGLVLCLSLLLSPLQDTSALVGIGLPDMVLTMLRELFLGVVCAYVFLIFYYMLFFVGDVMDMQMGMSMAKVFDPGTSIQMSVSGNLISLIFILYIFATDSHLVLLRLFAASYQLIPVGAFGLSGNIAQFAGELFISAFSLAFRLALPFIMVELVLEISMGILMKLIPQIHVFVINIQFKLLLGFFMLLVFAPTVSNFIDHYITATLQSVQKALVVLGG